MLATLAEGNSRVRGALSAGDGASALRVARTFGANVNEYEGALTISGIGNALDSGERECDCGNSGTSMRLFAGAAALSDKPRRFDGDASLRGRLMWPLLDALGELGATYVLLEDGRDVPFIVNGPIRGGHTSVSGVTSQFVSSLLLCTPLASGDSVITVENLNEKPYVDLTLWWLRRMGIAFRASEDYTEFRIQGGQSYKPFDIDIPGDFSSATFPAVAAAVCGSRVTLTGLDFSDPQGDKRVFDMLERLGVGVQHGPTGVTVESVGRRPRGADIDLNANPDALPALAVLGTVAEGETRLSNVPQARLKETDRISVMARELGAMGADIREEPDALVVRQSELRGATVNGYDDHRVVMSLALAGLIAEGETVIEGADAAQVTYPRFLDDLRSMGADIKQT